MAGQQKSSPGTFQLIVPIKAEVPLPRLHAADGGLPMYPGYLPFLASERCGGAGTYRGRTRAGEFLQDPQRLTQTKHGTVMETTGAGR